MEFMNFLELAHRKQTERDKEVERLIELDGKKRKERHDDFARAEKARMAYTANKTQKQVEKTCVTSVKPVRAISKESKVPDRYSSTGTYQSTHPGRFEHKGENALAASSQPESTSCIKQMIPVNCNNAKKHQNIIQNSTMSNVKKTPDFQKPDRTSTTLGSNQQLHSVLKAADNLNNRNQAKLSFTDLMELAKKNVHPQSSKKSLFDELIPCAADSKYRRLDPKSANNEANAKTHDSIANGISTKSSDNLKPRKSFKNQSHCTPLNVNSSDKTRPLCKTEKPSLNETSTKVYPTTKNKSIRIPEQLSMKRIPNELSKNVEFKHTNISPREPASDNRTALKPENAVIRAKVKPRITDADRAPISQTVRKIEEPPKKPAFSDRKLKEHSTYSKSRESTGVAINNQPPVKRGIAAQLCVNSLSRPQPNDYSDDDDHESDDSFIDDSEAVEMKTYARVVRDVHKALRFDPRKYKEVNPFDDLHSMESKYREIEKEEKRTYRLGAREDAIELEKDMERKRMKLAQKRH